MKKIVVTMVATFAFISGVACGSGPVWSDADKAQLQQSLAVAKAFGILTDGQAECMSAWMQNRYDSWEAAEADDGNEKAKKDLVAKCNIDPKFISSNDSEEEIVTTTTTTQPSKADSMACKEAEQKFQDYVFNNSEQDYETFSRLFDAAQAVCS